MAKQWRKFWRGEAGEAQSGDERPTYVEPSGGDASVTIPAEEKQAFPAPAPLPAIPSPAAAIAPLAGAVTRTVANVIEGVAAPEGPADAAIVDFSIAGQSIARCRLIADQAGGASRFKAVLPLGNRAVVNVRLLPDDIELEGSPIAVNPPVVTAMAAASTPEIAFEIVKPLALTGGEVALFVTHTRTGAVKPHVLHHIRALRAQNIAVVLVVVADNPCSLSADMVEAVTGAMVRENRGYDFAAWANCLRAFPQLYGADILYLVNDSLVGPGDQDDFARLIGRIRDSEADLVGLTSNFEYRWHLQSFFLALKPALLASGALHRFFGEIAILDDKEAVIRAYELRFAPEMEAAGFRVEALFDAGVAGNPTLKAWRRLIEIGFPYVKALLLRGHHEHIDITGWQEFLDDHGFDLGVVNASLDASSEHLPIDPQVGLVGHRPWAGQPTRAGRIAYLGLWNFGGREGDQAQHFISALRASGADLSLLSVSRAYEGDRLHAPLVDIPDFAGAADIAIVDIAPPRWHDLSDKQRAVLRRASTRIGVIRGDDIDLDGLGDFAGEFDWLWVSDPGLFRMLASRGGVRLTRIADLDGAGAEGIGAIGEDPTSLSLAAAIADLGLDFPAPLPEPIPFDLAAGIFARVDALGRHLPILVCDADGAPHAEREPDDATLAACEWLVIAPDGTLLAPLFASVLLAEAASRPEVDIFYGDDLALDAPWPIDQRRLKPEFDPTLLAAQDYIGAPVMIRAYRYRELGGLRHDLRTAALADLLFRGWAAGMQIARIPTVLLAHPGARVRARDEDYQAMLAAQPHLAGFTVTSGLRPGTTRIAADFAAIERPGVTIVIPTCGTALPDGQSTYVERLLDALREVDWPHEKLAVIVGDDRAGAPALADGDWPFALDHVATPRAGERFNYAAKMNQLWRRAQSEHVVFLNDDLLPVGRDWLAALLTYAIDPAVGGVGACLRFPDGRLQHAGIAPFTDAAAHLWFGRRALSGTYQDWAVTPRQWSMVTGAVFATRRSVLTEVDGFDERFSLEFNDTDLCLRLRARGHRIVYTPHAEFFHDERASRKSMPPPGDEVARFRLRWRDWLDHDPHWHPALRRDRLEMQPGEAAGEWYQ